MLASFFVKLAPMKNIAIVAVLLLGFLASASCSGRQSEALAEESKATMEAFLDLWEEIETKEDAEASVPKFEELARRKADLDARIKALSDAEQAEMMESLESSGSAAVIKERMQKAMSKLMSPDLEPILLPVLKSFGG